MLNTYSHQATSVAPASLRQISIATFLGGSLAGGSLLALNFLENDRPRAAAMIFLISVLMFVAVVSIPIDVSVASFIFPLLQMIVMRTIASLIYDMEMLPEPDSTKPYPWITVWVLVVMAIVLTLGFTFGAAVLFV